MSILDTLIAFEAELPNFLADAAGWQSLKIDYHPPHVDRLWQSWGDFRVFLHRILPCAPSAALFHRHPWPAAIRIVTGRYEMGLAHGAGEEAPPMTSRFVLTSNAAYEMTDPLVWHYVAPIGEPSLSLMVTGERWGKGSHKPERRLSPLADETREELLDLFRARYPSED